MENTNTSLEQKLGLKPGLKAFTLNAPSRYKVLLPEAIPLQSLDGLNQPYDWLQAFYIDKHTLEKELNMIKANMSPTSQVWISWPKKSSGVLSDLSDNVVRSVGISTGLVDLKWPLLTIPGQVSNLFIV